ncbi:MAG: S8/S53 family peptidase, partial [bacterium]|nr:S8/S53 family peptidase [bacterium]
MEYRDQLVEINYFGKSKDIKGAMHGTATASLLVGKNCGVAPGASLFLWAITPTLDYTQNIAAIDQILAYNEGKVLQDKIRVLSISQAVIADYKKSQEYVHKLKEAIKKGVIVVFVEYSFNGCAYSWSGDRDKTCDVWSTFKAATEPMPKNLFYIPCENLTTAAGFGDNDYTFWGKGGISWAVPVLAGVIT